MKDYNKADYSQTTSTRGKRLNRMSKTLNNNGDSSDSNHSGDEREYRKGLDTLDDVHHLTKPKNRTDIIWVTLRVAGKPLKMEIDTGSAYSVIPYTVYKKLFKRQQLQPTPVKLRTYMGELVVPVGKLCVTVHYKNNKSELDLYVIKGGRQVLFGRDWFWEIKLD